MKHNSTSFVGKVLTVVWVAAGMVLVSACQKSQQTPAPSGKPAATQPAKPAEKPARKAAASKPASNTPVTPRRNLLANRDPRSMDKLRPSSIGVR